MRLIVGDSSLRVAQLGPELLLLEEAAEHPPTEAEFQFTVDQGSRRWRVLLPEGISRDSREVRLAPIAG